MNAVCRHEQEKKALSHQVSHVLVEMRKHAVHASVRGLGAGHTYRHTHTHTHPFPRACDSVERDWWGQKLYPLSHTTRSLMLLCSHLDTAMSSVKLATINGRETSKPLCAQSTKEILNLLQNHLVAKPWLWNKTIASYHLINSSGKHFLSNA